jgi:hypothetical protein
MQSWRGAVAVASQQIALISSGRDAALSLSLLVID